MGLRLIRNRLLEIRQKKGLSAIDLNVLTGIPFPRIYYLERGVRTPTDSEKAVIAKALGYAVEMIFPRELETSPEVFIDDRNALG